MSPLYYNRFDLMYGIIGDTSNENNEHAIEVGNIVSPPSPSDNTCHSGDKKCHGAHNLFITALTTCRNNCHITDTNCHCTGNNRQRVNNVLPW